MSNLSYRTTGDYLIPELTIEKPPTTPLGKYGMMRRTYLKQHRGGTYQSLLLSGRLNEHLQEIDQTAQERIELLMNQLLENEPAPEKEKDPIGWAAHMNMLHQIAEETVLNELIYS